MRTTISSKGQIVLPAELRTQDRLAAGEQFEVERVQAGEYVLRRLQPAPANVLEWLQACPEKGWFEPLPRESTASL